MALFAAACSPDDVCPQITVKSGDQCLQEREDTTFPSLQADSGVRLGDVVTTGDEGSTDDGTTTDTTASPDTDSETDDSQSQPDTSSMDAAAEDGAATDGGGTG